MTPDEICELVSRSRAATPGVAPPRLWVWSADAILYRRAPLADHWPAIALDLAGQLVRQDDGPVAGVACTVEGSALLDVSAEEAATIHPGTIRSLVDERVRNVIQVLSWTAEDGARSIIVPFRVGEDGCGMFDPAERLELPGGTVTDGAGGDRWYETVAAVAATLL